MIGKEVHTLKTLGEKIRSARQRRGMTMAQLAEEIGVAVSTLTNYENNYRIPDLKIAKRIIEALNIDSDYFLGINRFITKPDHASDLVLTPHEENLVRAYRRSDQKEDVNKLLNIYDVDFVNSFILKYNEFPKQVQQEIETMLMQKMMEEKRAKWTSSEDKDKDTP
jgi:transcriptional regulator with XRE-family HTH domain